MPLESLKKIESSLGKTRFSAVAWATVFVVSMPLALFLAWPAPDQAAAGDAGPVKIEKTLEPLAHVPMPDEVRGVYLTSFTAGVKNLREPLVAYAARNRLNAFVIDVKNADGSLAFEPRSEMLVPHMASKPSLADMDAFLAELGQKGYYRIARVFVFQDPAYARSHPREAIQRADGSIWADYKGVIWASPWSKAVWDYNATIAKEIFERGFDEVQFDYIRFPSDGNMKAINYPPDVAARPKHETIRDFFAYMHRELEIKNRIPISYDLFGYVTWYVDYDLGIGQLLVDALPNATAISAMVYPSHYSKGTLGFANPAEHPYEIVADSLRKANKLYQRRERECGEVAAGTRSATSTLLLPCDTTLAQHRPWIQAFDIGAVYDAEKIRKQIQAVRDQGGKGFLLWNARNVYRDFAVETATNTPPTR